MQFSMNFKSISIQQFINVYNGNAYDMFDFRIYLNFKLFKYQII